MRETDSPPPLKDFDDLPQQATAKYSAVDSLTIIDHLL